MNVSEMMRGSITNSLQKGRKPMHKDQPENPKLLTQYTSERMKPGINRLNQTFKGETQKEALKQAPQSRKIVNQQNYKNLLDSYCKELVKRIQHPSTRNQLEQQFSQGQEQKILSGQISPNSSKKIVQSLINQDYNALANSQNTQRQSQISADGQSLQNLDLLNNFFTASGKNNFYNSLNSFKTSPHLSPRPFSNNDCDVTFARDPINQLNQNPDIYGAIDKVQSVKSWDLEEDEINEFNEEEEKVQNNKPTIQFIEKPKSKISPRAKTLTKRSRSHQRDSKSQSQQRSSMNNSKSPIKYSASKSPHISQSLCKSRDRIKDKSQNLNSRYFLQSGKVSTSFNQRSQKSSTIRDQSKKDLSISKERQLQVIKQSLKKRVSSIEKDELFQKLHQESIFRQSNQTMLQQFKDKNFSNNSLLNKVEKKLSQDQSSRFYYKQQIREKEKTEQLEKLRLEKEITEEIKYKQEVNAFSVHKKAKQVDIQNVSDRLFRDSMMRYAKKQIQQQDKYTKEDEEQKQNVSITHKRGRQSNQRNQVSNRESFKDTQQQLLCLEDLNQFSNIKEKSQSKKVNSIGGSQLFNAAIYQTKTNRQSAQYNFSMLQVLEDSPLRKVSIDRISQNSSSSRQRGPTTMSKPVVHNEYSLGQSNKLSFKGAHQKEKTSIFK